jgi:hypothetical protein
LDDLLAAEMQRDEGVTQNTKDKESRVWRRWNEYAKSIGFQHDIWLTSSYHPNVYKLLELSPLPLEGDNFLTQTNNAWLLQQSKRPWQNWVRSLGQTWGTTPHMEME